jgi:hypothetical protein
MLEFTRYMKNEIVYEPCYARARGDTAAPVSRNQMAENTVDAINYIDKAAKETPDRRREGGDGEVRNYRLSRRGSRREGKERHRDGPPRQNSAEIRALWTFLDAYAKRLTESFPAEQFQTGL